MRSIYKYFVFATTICTLLFSCKKYEDYTKDFDFSSVYFASQKPLRTIVGYDAMSFKMGVVLAGKKENKVKETAGFVIDPGLLNKVAGASALTLLPASYYTLSNTTEFEIPEGKFLGEITVTLNKAAFTADPLSLSNTYAIPLRLTKTTADSILRGKIEGGVETVAAKDYTILVVKYISPYHGTYYHKGIENTLNTSGGVASTTAFSVRDLSKNATWNLSTLNLNGLKTNGAGTKTNASLNLSVATNNVISISAATGVTVTSGQGTYNPAKREFYLKYNYMQSAVSYEVTDTLILRQAPELDLRYEEW